MKNLGPYLCMPCLDVSVSYNISLLKNIITGWIFRPTPNRILGTPLYACFSIPVCSLVY